jgi:hypothetical protein
MSTLKIEGLGGGENDYEDETPERMQNKLFPGFPTTAVFCGPPGSGKTNTIVYMLRSPTFWNGFFDEIHPMGPTIESDSLYKSLNFEKDRICTNPKKLIPFLSDLLEEQQNKVETDKKGAPKKLFLFEDLTSFFHKIQNNEDFIRCFCQIRHLKGTAIAVVHKYKAFNRTCRNCCKHLLIWQPLLTEINQLYEDFAPPNMGKKDWQRMILHATTPTKEEPHLFLYINRSAPIAERYRRTFTEILAIPVTPHRPLTEKRRKKNKNFIDRTQESPRVHRKQQLIGYRPH